MASRGGEETSHMPGKEDLLRHAEQLGVDPSAVDPASEAAARRRARPDRSAEAARRFAIGCARLMGDDRCERIVVFDLRGISPVCDFFVIGTGTSDRQMRAVADHIKEMAREQGERPYSTSGYDEGTWIVADYVDVIVHLFDEDRRAYYDLDSLWGDSPHVAWMNGE